MKGKNNSFQRKGWPIKTQDGEHMAGPDIPLGTTGLENGNYNEESRNVVHLHMHGRRGYKGPYAGKQGQITLMETIGSRKDKNTIRERRKTRTPKGSTGPKKDSYSRRGGRKMSLSGHDLWFPQKLLFILRLHKDPMSLFLPCLCTHIFSLLS
jgi:hypothetical protein